MVDESNLISNENSIREEKSPQMLKTFAFKMEKKSFRYKLCYKMIIGIEKENLALTSYRVFFIKLKNKDFN